MKKLLIAALVAAQNVSPLAAAELPDDRGAASQRHGAFAGARLRLPLGGEADRKLHAGVTVAPIAQGVEGESRRVRFGEGLELGFDGRDKPALAFGGRPVSQLAQGPAGPDGDRLGTSTGTGLLIVGGIVVLALGGVALLLMSQE